MKVIWKPGYSPAGVSAQTAHDVISDLYAKGKKTAKDLVDASRADDAPLHRLFEWDDSIAAERFREDQARTIIRHIATIEEPEDMEEMDRRPVIVRSFFHIDDTTSDYEPTTVILQNPDKKMMLLSMARREMEQFKAKYAALTELTGVFDAIDKVLSELDQKG